LSIHGFFKSDWEILILRALEKDPEMLELNLSCPNVTKTSINEALEAAHYAYKLFGNRVIAKLSPVKWMEFVNPLTDLGVSTFHLCNTIASPGGGFSGKVLKQYSMWAVEEVRKKYGYAHIIGGGGVTHLQDVKDYISAGADDVAVASMLFNPLNWGMLDIFKDYLCTLS
jgi:dihydroorotate dehydrogenase